MSAGPTRLAIAEGYTGLCGRRSHLEFTTHVTPCLLSLAGVRARMPHDDGHIGIERTRMIRTVRNGLRIGELVEADVPPASSRHGLTIRLGSA